MGYHNDPLSDKMRCSTKYEEMVLVIKYALVESSGYVTRYDGEHIEGLVAGDVNNRVTETQALNMLGAKGYRRYDTVHGKNGDLPRTTHRLEAVCDE